MKDSGCETAFVNSSIIFTQSCFIPCGKNLLQRLKTFSLQPGLLSFFTKLKKPSQNVNFLFFIHSNPPDTQTLENHLSDEQLDLKVCEV